MWASPSSGAHSETCPPPRPANSRISSFQGFCRGRGEHEQVQHRGSPLGRETIPHDTGMVSPRHHAFIKPTDLA